MSKTNVTAPGPTQAEQDLQQAQLDAIKAQAADTAALKPFLAQSAGFNYDPATNTYTKMTEAQRVAAMSPLEKASYDLANAYNQRQMDALQGKLPVDPALENDLAKRQKMMETQLSAKLGPNWQTSTPGIQAMDTFNRQAEALRQSARMGTINTGEGLLATQMGLLGNQQQQNTSTLQNWGLPAFGTMQGAYSNALQPYQFDRSMQFQANQQTAANKAGLLSGAFGLLGTGLGAYGALK